MLFSTTRDFSSFPFRRIHKKAFNVNFKDEKRIIAIEMVCWRYAVDVDYLMFFLGFSLVLKFLRVLKISWKYVNVIDFSFQEFSATRSTSNRCNWKMGSTTTMILI